MTNLLNVSDWKIFRTNLVTHVPIDIKFFPDCVSSGSKSLEVNINSKYILPGSNSKEISLWGIHQENLTTLELYEADKYLTSMQYV